LNFKKSCINIFKWKISEKVDGPHLQTVPTSKTKTEITLHKTKEDAIVESLDYKVPITRVKEV